MSLCEKFFDVPFKSGSPRAVLLLVTIYFSVLKKGRNFMPEFLVSAGLWVIKIIKFMQGKGPFLSFPCRVSSEFFLWKMLVILFNTFTGKISMAIPQTVI